KDRAEHGDNEPDRRHQRRKKFTQQGRAVRRFGIGSDRRRLFWKQNRDRDQIKHIEQDQSETRNDRGGEQIGDRHRQRRKIALRQLRRLIGIAELIAEQNQDGSQRGHLPQ